MKSGVIKERGSSKMNIKFNEGQRGSLIIDAACNTGGIFII